MDREYYGVARAWQEAALTDPDLTRMQREIQAWTQSRVLGVLKLLCKYPGRDLPEFARMMDHHFWWLMGRGSRITRREIRLASDVIYFYLCSGGTPGS